MDNPSSSDARLLEAFVRIVVEISPELLSVLKEVIASNFAVEARLVAIDKKLDQVILREINGALQMISSLATIASARMKEQHLSEAESFLLRNVSLDPSLSTAGLPNAYWMGRAYFGLSTIALLRAENKDASRFMLKVFEISPKDARQNLVKDIYASMIEPNCADIVAEYERQKTLLPQHAAEADALRRKIRWHRMGQAGMAVVGGAAAFFLGGANRAVTMKNASKSVSAMNKEIAEIQAKIDDLPTPESILVKMDAALDEKCREFAQRLLNRS